MTTHRIEEGSVPLKRRGFVAVRRVSMRRLVTETEKAKIIEREWMKARAKNPEVVMRVTVQDETDESGKPKVNVVIALKHQFACI
jgi:hypothetical protein